MQLLREIDRELPRRQGKSERVMLLAHGTMLFASKVCEAIVQGGVTARV